VETSTALDPRIAELRVIEVLHDLPDEDLAWLLDAGEWMELAPGGHVAHAGEPADGMGFLLDGDIEARRQDAGGPALFRATKGDVVGKLPFSRMRTYSVDTRAVTPVRLLRMHESRFTEMLRRIPVLEQRLVALMTDRVREVTRMDQQRERLLSLGRLAAGLAHELNNPAAAAARAVGQLRDGQASLQRRAADLYRECLDLEELDRVQSLADDAVRRARTARPMAPMEHADREDALAARLEEMRVPDVWDVAPVLVSSGLDLEWAEEAARAVTPRGRRALFSWLAATLTVDALLREVEHSVQRISHVVDGVKGYTFMDRSTVQDVDVHAGLDATIAMLAHKTPPGIAVVREYDPDVATVEARGGELNQVWTNLLDNAIDALRGAGTLRVRTAVEFRYVLVEVCDDGPGIAPDILEHVWEPFFTTKQVGEGMGLGLDVARRIVASHGGSMDVESRPGLTRFQVRLPRATGPEGDHGA
jgi:signal transduction histidine kinase